MRQMERADRDEMDLRAALAGAKSQDDVAGILRGRGRVKEAREEEAAALARRKAEADLKTAELTRTESAFKHYRDVLGTVQDAKQAEAFVVSSYNDPVVGPMLQRLGPLEEGLARLRQAAATPEGFRDWQAKAAVGIQKLAELAKVQQVDSGGKVATQVYNPVTGAVNTVATTQKTMTPGEAASNSVARGNLAVAQERLALEQAQPKGVYDPTQGVLIDPRTGRATPVVGPDGNPLTPKKPTEQQAKVTDAKEAIAIINQAVPMLKNATGSYFGTGIDRLGQLFGVATEGSIATGQLKALEGILVSKMPKMSGPQSDKDVALYRQMAAEIGDPTIPNARKAAALETVREIQERYAGMSPGSSRPQAPGGRGQPGAAPAAAQPKNIVVDY
jgi:hypothetical protein